MTLTSAIFGEGKSLINSFLAKVFSDNNFSIDKRDALYYVRAIEKESKAVNANNLRCELDQFGNCKEVNICYGSPLQTPREEDCLANTQERAWSSPIFVDYKKY